MYSALRERIELKLNTLLPADNALAIAMRYAVLNGGKRIRPLFTYVTGLCFGADLELLDAPAAAIEFMHCYSLVHDDLPAMDNDDWRRGKPTVHKAYDEATAILVGDALQNLSFEILSQPRPDLAPDIQVKMLRMLSQASGCHGMILGQMMDIQSVGKTLALADIEQMHRLKTGLLMRTSILLGATVASCTPQQTALLSEFADTIGLAFQVKDDILDATSTREVLGKTAQLDQQRQKATAHIQLEVMEQRLHALYQHAEHCLSQLQHDTSDLVNLARYVIQRSH